MVWNAREDFPDQLTQVMVMSLFFGSVRSIFLRLFTLIHSKTRDPWSKKWEKSDFSFCIFGEVFVDFTVFVVDFGIVTFV